MRAAWMIVAALAVGVAPAAAAPSEKAAAPATPFVDLQVGVAVGGSAFLTALHGPVSETTAQFTSAMFVRLRLPVISWRVLEAYAVWNHGAGLTVMNDDLHVGPVRLHLFDLGLFYAVAKPITVQRVARRWDLAVGTGAEIAVARRVTLAADVRMFCPLDVFGVLTRNGDASRLVGEEVLKGAQLWGGISYRW